MIKIQECCHGKQSKAGKSNSAFCRVIIKLCLLLVRPKKIRFPTGVIYSFWFFLAARRAPARDTVLGIGFVVMDEPFDSAFAA
mmetsp:Transcript_20259/g.38117  ORF Transcript_20259/g.38117 Transcript_20259/m.38117 type:complete len:83 (-) Transcript_20259:162-410(-)